MELDFLKYIGSAAIGALGTYLGVVWQRQTHASNSVFNLRVVAVREIWEALLEVLGVFNLIPGKGLSNFKLSHEEEAQSALDRYKYQVERNKVLLPPDVIGAFLTVDRYLFDVLNRDDIKPGKYYSELKTHLRVVATSVNGLFRMTNHKIDLEFDDSRNK